MLKYLLAIIFTFGLPHNVDKMLIYEMILKLIVLLHGSARKILFFLKANFHLFLMMHLAIEKCL